MSKVFEYIFKVNTNYAIKGLSNLQKSMLKFTKSFSELKDIAFKFSNIGHAFQEAGTQLNELIQPGVAFESQMKDLQAITGVTGKKLTEIGEAARQTAKTFGGDAAQSVESYKLLLSQLGPAIGQNPEALKSMGKNVAILSKTMGGDAKAATEVLTAAMNQFGVDLSNPVKASSEMARMMNVMVLCQRKARRTALY